MIALLLAAALVGPPAPDPYAAIEARMAEVKRVADGTFTDAAMIAVGSAVDIWGTERCISNGTCTELNPLGQDSGTSRLAVKAAMYPLKVGACYTLRRHGYHKAARILAVVVTAVDVGLGIHAIRLSNQGR